MKNVFDWLIRYKVGLLIGAIIGVLIGFIALKTGNTFFIVAFPGVFFGGAFFSSFFTMPAWVEVVSVFVNILVLGLAGAWIESLLKNVRKRQH